MKRLPSFLLKMYWTRNIVAQRLGGYPAEQGVDGRLAALAGAGLSLATRGNTFG